MPLPAARLTWIYTRPSRIYAQNPCDPTVSKASGPRDHLKKPVFRYGLGVCVYKILSFYLFSFDQEVVYRHTNPQTNIYRVFFLAPRNFKIEYLRKSLTDFHFKKFFEKLRVCGIWWFFTKFRYDENKCVLNGTGKKYGFHNM